MDLPDVSLAALIAPLSEAEFFQEYWDRKPLYQSRPSLDAYRNVLRREDVDAYLARKDIRYPALRMAKDGIAIPAPSYSKILTFGSYASEGLVNVDRALALHDLGATIILQMTRSSIPRLAVFANKLQRSLHFNVETTVYITPRNSQGFTTHYDTHGVFVLQIEGKKRWRLYDVMQELPSLTQTFDTCEVNPGPVRQEVVLGPGDFLYVPRGFGHDAIAENDGPSLHVSVGLFPPLWLDLFRDLLEEMTTEVQFRRSPLNTLLNKPVGGLRAAESEFGLMLQQIIGRFDAERLMRKHRRAFSAELTQSNTGRLSDYLSHDFISLDTIVARRQDIDCIRYDTNRRITLEFYEKQLTFPIAIAPAIACVFDRERFLVKEVQANLSDNGKLTFVRKLVTEGLLRIEALRP